MVGYRDFRAVTITRTGMQQSSFFLGKYRVVTQNCKTSFQFFLFSLNIQKYSRYPKTRENESSNVIIVCVRENGKHFQVERTHGYSVQVEADCPRLKTLQQPLYAQMHEDLIYYMTSKKPKSYFNPKRNRRNFSSEIRNILRKCQILQWDFKPLSKLSGFVQFLD